MARSQEEILEEILHSLGKGANPSSPGDVRNKREYKDLDALLKTVTRLNESYKITITENQLFNKMLRNTQTAITSAVEAIDELDEQFKTATATEQKLILEKRKEIETTARSRQAQVLIGQSLEMLKKNLSAGVSGAGSFIKGLQSGSSGIELASGLMETSLTMAGETSRMTGNMVGTLGGTLAMSTNPYVKGLGIAASIAGPALGMLGEEASKLAKFGVEVLSKEVEKTVKAFHTATSAGALFGRGMDDLRNYSSMAGITIDDFAEVIKGNSKSLSDAGYTVAEGAKITAGVTAQFANLTGKSGNKLQRELQNLGFGFKEQADLVTQSLVGLKRSGGTASNEQVARATVEMALNMRKIADITGEDAKQRMDAAKQQSEQYAFDRKIRQLAREQNDPGLILRVRQALGTLDETSRRAAVQSVVLNGVVTDVSANVLGMADPAKQFNQVLRNGGSSFESMLTPFAKASQTFDARMGDTGDAISTAIIAMKKKIYNVRFKGATSYSPMPLWNYLVYLAKHIKK